MFCCPCAFRARKTDFGDQFGDARRTDQGWTIALWLPVVAGASKHDVISHTEAMQCARPLLRSRASFEVHLDPSLVQSAAIVLLRTLSSANANACKEGRHSQEKLVCHSAAYHCRAKEDESCDGSCVGWTLMRKRMMDFCGLVASLLKHTKLLKSTITWLGDEELGSIISYSSTASGAFQSSGRRDGFRVKPPNATERAPSESSCSLK